MAWSSNRIAWEYTDIDGNVRRVAALKYFTDQNKLGGAAAAGTVPERVNQGAMRRISLSDGAGHSRVVPVYDLSAPIIAASATLLVTIKGVEYTLTSAGRWLQEVTPRRNATKQST